MDTSTLILPMPPRQHVSQPRCFLDFPAGIQARTANKHSPNDATDLRLTGKNKLPHVIILDEEDQNSRLLKLPLEILSLITEQMPPEDLYRLSRVCKQLHRALIPEVYKGVMIIYTENQAAGVDAISFKKSYFGDHNSAHSLSVAKFIKNLGVSVASHAQAEQMLDKKYVKGDALARNLGRSVANVFSQIPDNSLTSFSWHLGRAPANLFGESGLLATKQSMITSLAVNLYHKCFKADVRGLAKLTNLRHLAWGGTGPAKDFCGLVQLLRASRDRLEDAEIAFSPWSPCTVMDGLKLLSESGLDTTSAHTRFASLRHLSLSNISMGATVEQTNLVFPLKQLVSLKLNHCKDVLPFLETARYSGQTGNLKVLELTYPSAVASTEWCFLIQEDFLREISEFLRSSTGLEELYVSLSGISSNGSCYHPEALASHSGTLKRLVLHGFHDLVPCLGGDWSLLIPPRTRLAFYAVPQRPLNVDCLGVGALPADIAYCFWSQATQQNWRFLHFRMTAARHDPQNLLPKLCRAGLPKAYFPPSMRDTLVEGPAEFRVEDLEDPKVATLKVDDEPRVKGMTNMADFLRFAAWAFGPNGFRKLQILALGDFTKGDENAWSQVLLCRQPHPVGVQPAFCFRVMHPEDTYLWDVVDGSREVLRACVPDDIDHFGSFGFDSFKGK